MTLRVRLAVAATPLLVLAGCGQSGANRAAPSADGVTIDLPPATPVPNRSAQAAPVAAQPETSPAKPAPHRAGVDSQREAKPRIQIEPPEPSPAPAPTEQVNEARSAGSSAKLPLPDAVVARTIERIGYPCGRVTSSASPPSDGGGAPAYKVTCSSGASYRASTVHGRLRFRQWGR
jgi:hypothetical protein